MAEKGWISKYAFQDDALDTSTDGRAAMADGYVNTAKLGDAAVTPVKTSGVAIPNVLGAPTVKAGSLDDVHAAITMPDTGTEEVTTGITDPDVPRSINVKGNQAGIGGDLVIEGTNYNNEAISETYTLNGTSEVVGSKAFKTVTKITVPVKNGAGDTVVVGRGNKLGLHQALSAAGQVLFCTLNRAIQAPTVAVDATDIESNTVDLSAGTYNGTKVAVAMVYR